MRALLVDAGGTLVHVAEPVGSTYARFARARGLDRDEATVEAEFRAALRAPWSGPRQTGDGRPFWRTVVARALGTDDPGLFEALYAHYGRAAAWRAAPGAAACLDAVRAAGWRTAVVSNTDRRLVDVLAELGLAARFDAIAISGDVGVEKPDPALFRVALARLGVDAAEAIHVGDSDEDVAGARAAGCAVLRFGVDVASFSALRTRLLGVPGRPPTG